MVDSYGGLFCSTWGSRVEPRGGFGSGGGELHHSHDYYVLSLRRTTCDLSAGVAYSDLGPLGVSISTHIPAGQHGSPAHERT